MEGAAIAFLVYCLPGIIALLRHHHQTLAIAMLNLLLGWTVLGWVIALVWACTAVQHTAKEA